MLSSYNFVVVLLYKRSLTILSGITTQQAEKLFNPIIKNPTR